MGIQFTSAKEKEKETLREIRLFIPNIGGKKSQ
jgi:hypothetical protein